MVNSLWNPVKELKVELRLEDTPFVSTEWNPVKELKAIALQQKEHKLVTAVESGEGIESS